MDARSEHEAQLFVRYEARIVALELRVEDLRADCNHYWPLVDELRDGALVAQNIAAQLQRQASLKLTKVHVALAVVALFLPAIVGSLLTYALLHVG